MVGTLLAGVLVGQLGIQVPPLVKTVFFDLFLFTTGYKVGPQFFRGLKKDAFSQVALTVVLCVTCLVTAFVASKILGYDAGTAAGLLAGAFSESTVIGTAAEAINRLAIPAEEKTRLVNNIPIAYAVTYLLGTAGLVWFIPVIGPKLMGIDLKEESKKAQTLTPGAAEAAARDHVRCSSLRCPCLSGHERRLRRPDDRPAGGAAHGLPGLRPPDPPRGRAHRRSARA